MRNNGFQQGNDSDEAKSGSAEQLRCIGRERELHQLAINLGDGTDGLRVAMLVGPSGLGKTTLAGVALEQAEDRGFQIVRVNARAGSLTLPFHPWRESFRGFAEALDKAGVGAGGQVDMDLVGAAFIAELARLSADNPLLIAIDDVQALDESSLALLPYMTGVSETMNFTMLMIEQTDAVGVSGTYRSFSDGLVARRVVQRIELGPLDDDSIARIVKHELGMDDESEAPTEVVIRAQGNPWFAKELAITWKNGGAEGVVPVNVAAAATSRLYALPESAQDLVTSIALCPEGAYIGWIEAISGERPRSFVRTMESLLQSGIVREDGDIISVAHPLTQQALIDEMSAAMRRAVHLEIAEVIAGTTTDAVMSARAQGYHLASAGRTNDAVAQYLIAAEVSEIDGKLHEAYADLCRALEIEPRIDERVELLKKAAFMAVQIGDERADTHWSELVRIASAKHDENLLAFALFQQFWHSDKDNDVTELLDKAALIGPERYGWSARAAACQCWLNGDYATSAEHDRRAIAIAEEENDVMLQAMASEKVSIVLAYLGELDESIDRLKTAIRICTNNRYHMWAINAWGNLNESLAENLQVREALRECETALAYIDQFGLERSRSLVMSWQALALSRLGRVEDALSIARSAYEMESSRVVLSNRVFGYRYIRALCSINFLTVCTEAGDLNAIRAAISDAADAVTYQGVSSFDWEIANERAKLAVMNADVDEALKIISEMSIDEPASMACAAAWFTRIGYLIDNQSLVNCGMQIIENVESTIPYVELLRREFDTYQKSTEAVNSDVEKIELEWHESGRLLDAARVRAVRGALEIRVGEKVRAKETLKSAKIQLTSCGAFFEVDLVGKLLRSIGARSRSGNKMSEVGELTKREFEIASLVSSGLKNAEVAERLFLAEKTIAAHLSNIYNKTGVRSRVQLATWLSARRNAS